MKHIQLFGYYFEANNTDLYGGIKITDSYNSKLEIGLRDSDTGARVFYILDPTFEDLGYLDKRFGLNGKLFNILYVGALTQSYWHDIEIESLRSKPMLLGLNTLNEYADYFEKVSKTLSSKEIYDFLQGLVSRTKDYNLD